MFPTREYTTLAVQSPRLGSAKSPRLGNLTNAPHTPSTPQLAWRTSPRKQTRMLSVLPALLLCTAALLGLIALAVRQHRAMPTRERLRLVRACLHRSSSPLMALYRPLLLSMARSIRSSSPPSLTVGTPLRQSLRSASSSCRPTPGPCRMSRPTCRRKPITGLQRPWPTRSGPSAMATTTSDRWYESGKAGTAHGLACRQFETVRCA
jgi:hypothetical protein